MSNPQVLLETTSGEILVELFPENAPETVENFLAYVDEGFYEGTIFHRVIKDFMIQGGGYTLRLEEKDSKRAPVKNEAETGLKNTRGTMAMARTMDPHSATCQFFINVQDNPALDFTSASMGGYGYCAFGRVIEGLDVVDAIRKEKTKPQGMHDDVPVSSVMITAASRFE